MANKKVLVIESDESFANSIREMFAPYDAELTVVADGKEGLAKAKSGDFDLILLCVELPKMSGYSICTKIKKDKKVNRVPLVIMSSEATEETFEQHRKLKNRAEDYIIKPFSGEQLFDKLTALIDLERKQSDQQEDEVINLDDEEELVIEDLPDLDDEPLDLDGGEDGATQVMTSPLAAAGEDEDLENLEEVLDGLEMEEFADEDSAVQPEKADALDSLEVTAAAPVDAEETLPAVGGEEQLVEEDPELEELVATLDQPPDLDDLEVLPAEPEAPAEPAAADDEINLDEVLQPSEESESLPPESATPIPAAAPEPQPELESQPQAELESPPEPESQPQPEAEQEGGESFDVEVSVAASQSSAEPVPATAESAARPEADPVLVTKLKNAEDEVAHLRQKVAGLEQKLEQTHSDYEKRLADLSSSRRDTSKDKDVLALKSSLNAKDREILDLKEELTRKEQEILDVQEKVAERDEEIRRLQETIASRDREIKEISDRFDDMLRQKNDLQERHEAKMAEWEERYTNDTAKLEHDTQVVREEMAQLQKQIEQLQDTLEDTKQRHNDEVYGLRTRYKNEIDKLQEQFDQTKQELEKTRNALDEERRNHEQTKQQAEAIPQLEQDLEAARANIERLEQQVSELESQVKSGEERAVKAYERIKKDEKVKEKARKAIEIALTLLADQIIEDDARSDEESDIVADDAHR